MDALLTQLKRRVEADPDNEALKKQAAVRMVSAGLEPPWEWARLVYPGVSVLTVRNTAPMASGRWCLLDYCELDKDRRRMGKTLCAPGACELSKAIVIEEMVVLEHYPIDLFCIRCAEFSHFLTGSSAVISKVPVSWIRRYGISRSERFGAFTIIWREHKYWLPVHDIGKPGELRELFANAT